MGPLQPVHPFPMHAKQTCFAAFPLKSMMRLDAQHCQVYVNLGACCTFTKLCERIQVGCGFLLFLWLAVEEVLPCHDVLAADEHKRHLEKHITAFTGRTHSYMVAFKQQQCTWFPYAALLIQKHDGTVIHTHVQWVIKNLLCDSRLLQTYLLYSHLLS